MKKIKVYQSRTYEWDEDKTKARNIADSVEDYIHRYNPVKYQEVEDEGNIPSDDRN